MRIREKRSRIDLVGGDGGEVRVGGRAGVINEHHG